MCQMSLIHTGDGVANRTVGMVLMTFNSYIHNRDGTGYFNPKCGVKKTHIPACLINNFGVCMNGIDVDDSPFMCHVRAASTQNALLLTAEHAHPFESEHFVFQHNGTLVFKDKKKQEEYKDQKIIDSEIFLKELEKGYTGNVYEDIKNTVANFHGKFAFMLYHKPEKQYYVVRGKTALLYRQNIKLNGKEGFILNTEFDTLEKALILACNILQFDGFTTELIGKAEIVEVESVFKVEGIALTRLGSIVQTEAPVEPNFTTTGATAMAFPGGNIVPIAPAKVYSPVKNAHTNNSKDGKEMSSIVINFLSVTGLSIYDLDKVLVMSLGRGICSYCPALDKKIYENIMAGLVRRVNNRTKEMWGIMSSMIYPDKLYEKFSDPNKLLILQFPYFLTEASMFKQIYDEVVVKGVA